MGVRTTFVTEDINIKWPEWFIEKYRFYIHFKPSHTGAISSITEVRLIDIPDLEKDIQYVIEQWNKSISKEWMEIYCFRVVFLHEAISFINRPVYVEITQDQINYYESTEWKEISRDYLESENLQIVESKEYPEPLDLALKKRKMQEQ